MNAKRFFIGMEKFMRKKIICLLEIAGQRIFYAEEFSDLAAVIKKLCSSQKIDVEDIRDHLDKNYTEKRLEFFSSAFLSVGRIPEFRVAIIDDCPRKNELPFLPKTFFVFERDFTFRLSEIPDDLKKDESLVLLELEEPQLSLVQEQIGLVLYPKFKKCLA
jgi:hypothetical protein